MPLSDPAVVSASAAPGRNQRQFTPPNRAKTHAPRARGLGGVVGMELQACRLRRGRLVLSVACPPWLLLGRVLRGRTSTKEPHLFRIVRRVPHRGQYRLEIVHFVKISVVSLDASSQSRFVIIWSMAHDCERTRAGNSLTAVLQTVSSFISHQPSADRCPPSVAASRDNERGPQPCRLRSWERSSQRPPQPRAQGPRPRPRRATGIGRRSCSVGPSSLAVISETAGDTRRSEVRTRPSKGGPDLA